MSYRVKMAAAMSCAFLLVLTFSGAAIAQTDGALAKTETPASEKPAASQKKNNKQEKKKKRRVVWVEQKDGVEKEIPMAHGTGTTWYLLDPIVSHTIGNRSEYPPQFDDLGKRLVILPAANASPTNLNIETKVRMLFELRMATEEERPVAMVIVVPPGTDIEALVSDIECTEDDDCPDRENARYRRTAQNMDDRWEMLTAKSARFAHAGFELSARLSHQAFEGPVLKYKARLKNHGKAFPMKDLEVLPHARASEPVQAVVYWGADGMPEELAENEKLTVTVVIPDSRELDERMALRLIPSRTNVFPATFDFEEERPNVGRLAIQGQAVGGAISLKNNGDSGQADFTWLRGLGIRGVYSFTPNVSVEGSLTGLSTGEAQFDDNTRVDVASARALLGGMLHSGEKYVPYARLGFGARISDYSWRPAIGEPNSELRTSALFYMGAGMEAWFSNSLVGGISVNYVGGLGNGDDGSASFEAGVHFGYAWKP